MGGSDSCETLPPLYFQKQRKDGWQQSSFLCAYQEIVRVKGLDDRRSETNAGGRSRSLRQLTTLADMGWIPVLAVLPQVVSVIAGILEE